MKGRDYYDFMFYVENGFKVNIDFIRESLIQQDYLKPTDPFDINILKNKVADRIRETNFDKVLVDVKPFLINKEDRLKLNQNYFLKLTEQIIPDDKSLSIKEFERY